MPRGRPARLSAAVHHRDGNVECIEVVQSGVKMASSAEAPEHV